QRRVHGLITGDLDRAGHHLAGDVGGDVGEFRAEAGGHQASLFRRTVRPGGAAGNATLPSGVVAVYSVPSAGPGSPRIRYPREVQEACQSGRMGLTANELSR